MSSDDLDRRGRDLDEPPGRRVLLQMGGWVSGALLGLLGFLGLLLASGAGDGIFAWTGLGLFVFAVLLIFVLIHRHTGRR